MVSSTPKEDPQAKADRERDRRLATLDRRDSAQQEADDMTTDLRSVYGLSALSMFGRAGQKQPARSNNLSLLKGRLATSIFGPDRKFTSQGGTQQLNPKSGFAPKDKQ